MKGLNFTAIDFETANSSRRSACALGLIKVVDGEIVDKKYWLIKPEPFEVNFYNTRVHNITAGMLKDKPTFQEIWPEIEPYLTDQVLVAHNCSFDIDVLEKTLEGLNLNLRYEYSSCSQEASQNYWPEEPGFALPDLAGRLKIKLDHHNALSDASACAKIMIKIATESNTNDIYSFKRRRKGLISTEPFTRKKASSDRSSAFRPSTSETKTVDVSWISFTEIDHTTWTWENKNVLVTGVFEAYPDRQVLEGIIQTSGAKIAKGISKNQNVIIIGSQPGPAKLDKLKVLLETGHNPTLINEDILSLLKFIS